MYTVRQLYPGAIGSEELLDTVLHVEFLRLGRDNEAIIDGVLQPLCCSTCY